MADSKLCIIYCLLINTVFNLRFVRRVKYFILRTKLYSLNNFILRFNGGILVEIFHILLLTVYIPSDIFLKSIFVAVNTCKLILKYKSTAWYIFQIPQLYKWKYRYTMFLVKVIDAINECP